MRGFLAVDLVCCVSTGPVIRERYGGRHAVLIVLHVTEGLSALNSSPQKFFFVDKAIGAIWPNSSVQSQMKLFAEKINPLPPYLPLLHL